MRGVGLWYRSGMALQITRAHVQMFVEPGATAPVIVDYVLSDERDAALGKRGTIQLVVPAGVRSQLATLVEDTLRSVGIL